MRTPSVSLTFFSDFLASPVPLTWRKMSADEMVCCLRWNYYSGGAFTVTRVITSRHYQQQQDRKAVTSRSLPNRGRQ